MTDTPQGEFQIIPHWIMRDSNLDRNELLVFLALNGRAGKDGVAFPSYGTIAHDARLGERTVEGVVKRLIARGLISKEVRPREGGKGNYSNRYRVARVQRTKPTSSSLLTPPRTKPTTPKLTRVQVSSPERATTQTQHEQSEGRNVCAPPAQELRHPGAGVAVEVDTQEVNTFEEDVRSELSSGPDSGFAIVDAQELASSKQVAYLRDLYIHHHVTVPSKAIEEQIQALSPLEAKRLIYEYLAAIKGRNGMYDGPEFGTPEYNALSETGQEWADSGMVPPTVWEKAQAETPSGTPSHTPSSRGWGRGSDTTSPATSFDDMFAGMFSSKQLDR